MPYHHHGLFAQPPLTGSATEQTLAAFLRYSLLPCFGSLTQIVSIQNQPDVAGLMSTSSSALYFWGRSFDHLLL